MHIQVLVNVTAYVRGGVSREREREREGEGEIKEGGNAEELQKRVCHLTWINRYHQTQLHPDDKKFIAEGLCISGRDIFERHSGAIKPVVYSFAPFSSALFFLIFKDRLSLNSKFNYYNNDTN